MHSFSYLVQCRRRAGKSGESLEFTTFKAPSKFYAIRDDLYDINREKVRALLTAMNMAKAFSHLLGCHIVASLMEMANQGAVNFMVEKRLDRDQSQ